ncbi:hypothetical protein BDF19DRAFT_450684 [Syncephalis fuscata]|nr:hypothetical protein BDF19DRAFT_450684 [Syncephalis fuscata]
MTTLASEQTTAAATAERDAVAAGTQLEALIASYLLDERTAEYRVAFISELLESNALLRRCSGETNGSKVPSAALAKWCLRVSALLQSKIDGTRLAGIHLVRLTVRQGVRLEAKQAKLWTTLLMAQLNTLVQQQQQQQQQGLQIRNVASTILELLLVCVDMTELHKELVTPHASKFCAQMLIFAENVDVFPFVLETIAEVARHFPGPAKSTCERAARLCLSQIDQESLGTTELRKRAARCFPSLLIASGRVADEADTWASVARQIAGAVEDALNLLTGKPIEHNRQPTQLALPAIADDYPTRIPAAMQCIRFFLDCLADMQSRPRTAPVEVPLDCWLQLGRRLVSTDAALEGQQIDWQERQMIASVYSSLSVLSCRLVGHLIISFKQLMLPYIDQLATILLRTLTRTNDSRGRLAAYKTCRLALTTFGVNAGQLLGTKLISSVQQDVDKYQQTIATINSLVEGSLDARSSYAMTRDHPRRVYATRSKHDTLFMRSCQSGLDALHALLMTSGCLLSTDTRQQLDMILFNQALANNTASLFMAHGGSGMRAAHLNHAALNRVTASAQACLSASLCSPYDSVQANVLSCATSLFTHGRNAVHASIRDASRQGAHQCALLVQPRLPPLMRPTISTTNNAGAMSNPMNTKPIEEIMAMTTAYDQLPSLTNSSTLMTADIHPLANAMQMDIFTNGPTEISTATITSSKKRPLDESASMESEQISITEQHKERKPPPPHHYHYYQYFNYTQNSINTANSDNNNSSVTTKSLITSDNHLNTANHQEDEDEDAAIPDICFDSDSDNE